MCGALTSGVETLLLEFYLNHSGNMLCLCSDLLNVFLPNYRTAEVREQELAQFSYNRWQKVQLMHHIFCYQPSPVKKHFSHDTEDPTTTTVHQEPTSSLLCPKSIELVDKRGKKHSVDVDVLGFEETWRTPSILLTTNKENNGRAIFSQVHLESDPSQFEHDDRVYEALKRSNKNRLEILGDILATHLSVAVKEDFVNSEVKYSMGFLLADTEGRKRHFLSNCQSKLDASGCLSSASMNLCFLDSETSASSEAEEKYLPINVTEAPQEFDQKKFFEVNNNNRVSIEK